MPLRRRLSGRLAGLAPAALVVALALAGRPAIAGPPAEGDPPPVNDPDIPAVDLSAIGSEDQAPPVHVDNTEEEVADPQERAEPPAIEPTPETHGLLVGTLELLGSRDKVPGARIVDEGDEQLVFGNERGEFSMWLEPGAHDLLIRSEGFEDLRVTVEIEAGERLEYAYRLDLDLESRRYRTTVNDEREVAVSKTSLRDEEIREVPGTGGDPFRVVSSLPGVSQVAGFLPYVVVRGAAPGNTGYYLDGVRVPILFHVAVGPSVIHPYFIDQVDFYPSGAPVRLGRYTSGIIEGRTRPGKRDRVHGDFDVRITDAGGVLEVPFNRPLRKDCDVTPTDPSPKAKRIARRKCRADEAQGAIAIGGRYSYTGLVLSLIPALNVRLQFWDFQARVDHALGPRARYTAFAYGSFDSIGPRTAVVTETDEFGVETQSIDNDPDPFIQFEFYRLDNRIDQRLRNGAQIRYQLGFGLDRSGVTNLRSTEYKVMPRLTFQFPLRDGIELGMGWDQEFQIFRADRPEDLSSGDFEDFAQLFNDRFVSATALFADLRIKRGIWEIRPGIRGSAYLQVGASPFLPTAQSVTQAYGVDPRILLRQSVSDIITLRQSFGVYHQPPTSPIPLPGIESFGFERGLQRNTQGSFGYELDLFGKATLTQEAYLGRLSNLQDYELGQGSDSDANELEDFVVQVTGWAYGLETMLKLDPTNRVFGWLAYTLSRSVRNYPVGGNAPSTWDQTHIINLVVGYKIGKKWRIGGRLHFNTGRPYTTVMPGEDFFDALSENRNNARLPSFFQLDLRVERVWTFQYWMFHAFLDLNNSTLSREILNCASGGDPEARESTIPGCLEPLGLRYVLPTLGLRARF